MDTLENNPLAIKGRQFVCAINQYNETLTLPRNFLKDILDKLSIRDGYVLDIFQYGDKYGCKSRLYAHKEEPAGIYKGDYEEGGRREKRLFASLFNDGQEEKHIEKYVVEKYSDDLIIDGKLSLEAKNEIPDLQTYLSYPFTEEAVWQLFLLNIADTILPLYWHGGYSKRTFFFDRQSFLTFEHKEVAALADSDEIIPKVEITGEGTAIVKCCFWSDWLGLCVEDVIIERADEKVIFIRDKSRLKELFPYDSRKRF